MLVDCPHPGQHLAEVIVSYGDHERQSRGRAQRVAAADPVPHRKDAVTSDAEPGGRGCVRGHRGKMAIHRARPESRGHPGPSRPGVGQRLRGGETLGHHHEECLRRVQPVAKHCRQVGRVDIGHEMAVETAVTEGGQRLVGHGQTQMGSADSEVHHRADRSGRCSPALSGAHRTGKASHAVELGPHRRHHIDAVDLHRCVGAGPQRGVQGGTALGGVHRVAPQHRRDPLGHTASAGKRQQQLDGLGGRQVPRPVDHQIAHQHRGALGPVRVGLEQLPKMQAVRSQFAGMELQGRPLPG